MTKLESSPLDSLVQSLYLHKRCEWQFVQLMPRRELNNWWISSAQPKKIFDSKQKQNRRIVKSQLYRNPSQRVLLECNKEILISGKQSDL